jgi:hypothetical protein
MGSYRELPEGWPNPYDLLRDENWLENYPVLVLRGIHSVMQRIKGNPELKFKGAFNITLFALLRAHPPRLHISVIKDGVLSHKALTTLGIKREKEVRGTTKLSSKSIDRYGKKNPKEMRIETINKLDELRISIEIIRATTSEPNMPPKKPRSKVTGLP